MRRAQIMNTLVKWVEDQNRSEEKDSRVFVDKIATGLGWWKVYLDYSGEDLEGEICIHRRHMLSVFPDPNFFDHDWEDAEYVFDAVWLAPDEAAERWPDQADRFKRTPGEWLRITQGDNAGGGGTIAEQAGDPFASERLFFDPVTKRIRILEHWYKRRAQVTVLYHLGSGKVIDDQSRVAAIREALRREPTAAQQFIPIQKTVTIIRVAHLFAETILADEESPFAEPCFPLFPTIGFYFWKHPMGLAELMKDLQREKNKRRSKLIELVGRMPLSGFFNKKSGGADPKQIEEYGAGNGKLIEYETEIPQQIRPPDLPMAVVRLEDKSDEEIKDVPNVHNELLGQATQKTISGRAIEARQRGGLISHEGLFESFRQDKERVIKFLVSVIQQHMSTAKALRILGTIAAREPEGPLGQMMQQAEANPIDAQLVMETLSDAFAARFDVVISARPAEPSLAMQAWETLSELAQAKLPIPPKVLFEAARKAGIMTEDQVQEILQFVQGQPPPQPPAG